MSEAARPSDPDPSDRDRAAARRRMRAGIFGSIIAAILGIFAVLLLITQCGDSQDDVSLGSASGAVQAAVVGTPAGT
jgi:hypothetical protein